jgi:hypothetical protein
MVKIEGREVPNLLEELTIEQFDKLNNIENSTDLDSIEKWVYKFVYLGIPEDLFDDMEVATLLDYARVYNIEAEVPKEKQLTVVIDGYTYEAKETIGVKDMSLIEKSWKRNLGSFASDALSILFKRADLSRTEHYTNAHLKQKAKLFKSQKATLAVPFVTSIIQTLTNTVENEVTESLESNNG